MRKPNIVISIMAGLSAISAVALAQQPSRSSSEFPECALARKLYSERRIVEARNWQRACLEKQRADAASARAPTQGYNSMVAPVPSAPSPSQAAPPPPPSEMAPGQDQSWTNNLPSVADVKAAIHGPDSAVRQEAAFAVLREYIESHGGQQALLHGSPGTAQVRWIEYFNAAAGDEGRGYKLSPPARALFEQPAFKTETLSKFSGSEITKTTLARVETDKKSARDGHVDLSVFGIPLGEPLQLPACADQSSQYCLATDDAAKLQVVGLLTSMAGISAPGFSSGAPVKLPRSHCPRWVFGCTVSLDLQAGVPVGSFVQTTSDVDAVDQALVDKYGKAFQQGKGMSCRNTLTGIVTADAYSREWHLPGLLVVYSPIVDCNMRIGTVVARLRNFHDETENREKESRPKM
jgi:hypothetical protein